MTAPAPAPSATDTDTLASIGRLQQRVTELEAELAAAERINFELRAAADTTASYKASLAAGYIDNPFAPTGGNQ